MSEWIGAGSKHWWKKMLLIFVFFTLPALGVLGIIHAITTPSENAWILAVSILIISGVLVAICIMWTKGDQDKKPKKKKRENIDHKPQRIDTPTLTEKENKTCESIESAQNIEATQSVELAGEKQGTGGWLVYFQFRLYMGVLSAFGSFSTYNEDAQKLCMGVFIILIICLVNFYRRKIFFRAVYIFCVVLEILFLIQYLPETLGSLFGIIIVEGIIITALFRSKRVRNTFN